MDELQRELLRADLRMKEKVQMAGIDAEKSLDIFCQKLNLSTELKSRKNIIFFRPEDQSFWVSIPQLGTRELVRKLLPISLVCVRLLVGEKKLRQMEIEAKKDANGEMVNLVLTGPNCNGEGLKRALKKAGVFFDIAQSAQAELADEVFGVLLANPQEVYPVFRHRGWRINSGKLIFVDQNDLLEDEKSFEVRMQALKNPFILDGESTFFKALLSYTLHQALLRDNGIRLQKPIAICVEKMDDSEEIKRFLATFLPVKEADSRTPTKRLERMLQSAHAEPVFLEAGAGRYNQDNIETMVSWMRRGVSDGNFSDGVAVLFFKGWIPDDLREQLVCFWVEDGHIKRMTQGFYGKLELAIWAQNYLAETACVQKKLQQIAEMSGSMTQKALLAGGILTLNAGDENYDAMVKNLCSQIRNFLKEAEEKGDIPDLEEAFVDALYLWQREKTFSDCYDAECVPDNLKPTEMVAFDEDYLFIPRPCFEEIIKPLRKYASSIQIKKQLEDKGILVVQNTGTKEVKKCLKSKEGERKTGWFLRFKRDLLKRPGELDFALICQMRRNGQC